MAITFSFLNRRLSQSKTLARKTVSDMHSFRERQVFNCARFKQVNHVAGCYDLNLFCQSMASFRNLFIFFSHFLIHIIFTLMLIYRMTKKCYGNKTLFFLFID